MNAPELLFRTLTVATSVVTADPGLTETFAAMRALGDAWRLLSTSVGARALFMVVVAGSPSASRRSPHSWLVRAAAMYALIAGDRRARTGRLGVDDDRGHAFTPTMRVPVAVSVESRTP